MVEIKKISILLGLFLVLLMVPMVSGVDENVGEVVTGGHLIITDVDVKVDGKSDKNLRDGEDIGKEAKPGSTVEFTIRVANNFTDADDVEIEDIQLTVTIEGIDDDDDLEEEGKEFDLDADDDKKIKVEFEIPLEVDEDTFTVEILVEGDTNDNGSQEVKMRLDLDVEKENTEVLFTRNTLSPSEIICSRRVQLSTGVINTGSGDEDSVELEITNAELGVDFKETFDLTDDPFDDDSKFRKTFTFMVPNDVLAGIYPIMSKVTFDDGSETKDEIAELVVSECEALKEAEEEEEEEQEEPDVVVVKPGQPTIPTGVVTVTDPIITATVTEEKPLLESTWFIGALIAGEVLVVIIAVLLVLALMRRRS